jgi:nitroreductase
LSDIRNNQYLVNFKGQKSAATNDNIKMDLEEIIRKRKSCRTFREVPLNPEDKKDLEEYISNIPDMLGGEDVRLRIVEKAGTGRRMELNYGMIKGHNTYVLGLSGCLPDSRVHYGYLMEKVVLKAAEIGIATCWIGYFDESYFDEIMVGEGFEIPGIVILGYPVDRLSRVEKITRFAVNASQRFEWEKLFFDFRTGTPLNSDPVADYAFPLEMVRLAPSAGNTQPWRIFYDSVEREFHFFKKPVSRRYEEKGLHDIDLGISLAHFELASDFKALKGTWIKTVGLKTDNTKDLQFVMTWRCV